MSNICLKDEHEQCFKRFAELLRHLAMLKNEFVDVNLPLKFDEPYGMNDFEGKTPLTLSAMHGCDRSFELFITLLHADVFEKNVDGTTVIDYLLKWNGENFKPRLRILQFVRYIAENDERFTKDLLEKTEDKIKKFISLLDKSKRLVI